MSHDDSEAGRRRWQRVRATFEGALALQPAERPPFLARELADEPALRGQVEALLAADECEDGFLEPPDDDPAAESEPAPVASGELGGYRIVRALASGGMGTVYEAEQADPHRRVALKVLAHGLAASPTSLARFRDEVGMLARLRHPGIAQIYEAGIEQTDAGQVPWFAMELVRDAQDLASFAEQRALPLRARLELFRALCDAVAHGHQRGVIHRDLKPSNVLVDGEGRLRLIDFGVARAIESSGANIRGHTRTGERVGTPAYMAPEQLDGLGGGLDVRCDVYALGVLLYELLCGSSPFELVGLPVSAVTRIVSRDEPRRPSLLAPEVAGDLEWIVLKCLEKDPARRYASVAELLEDLRRHRRHEPVVAGPPSTVYRLRKFARRNRLLVAVSLTLLLGLGATVVGTTAGMFEARASGERARREAQKNELVLELVRGLFDGIEDTVEGRDVRVADLLDAAVLDFGADVARDPGVEATFRSLVGGVYHRLDQYEAAARQLERSLALVTAGAATLDAERALELRILLASAQVLSGAPEAGRPPLEAAIAEARRDGRAALELRGIELLGQYLLDEGSFTVVLEDAGRMAELSADLDDRGAELRSLRLYAHALAGLERHDEALRVFEDAHTALVREGPAPAATAALVDLAYAVVLSGDAPRALTLYAEALPAAERTYGPRHDLTLAVRSNLAAVAAGAGDHVRAAELYAEVVAAFEAREASLSAEYAIALHNLAMSLHMQRRFGEALGHFERAVTVGEELFSEGDLTHARHRLHLGVCLGWIEGGWPEAESILLEAWEVLDERLPEDHSVRRNAIEKIAVAYQIHGEADEARRWRGLGAGHVTSPASGPWSGR